MQAALSAGKCAYTESRAGVDLVPDWMKECQDGSDWVAFWANTLSTIKHSIKNVQIVCLQDRLTFKWVVSSSTSMTGSVQRVSVKDILASSKQI